MADMLREEAIDTLKRLKTTHMGDFGWDTTGIKALDFAITDMENVDELKTEVEALKTDLWFHRNSYWAIDAECKWLKNCLKIIKDTGCDIPSDILDNINEYFKEVGE